MDTWKYNIFKSLRTFPKLQYLSPRSALITIYKAFARPHLDYGDFLYDHICLFTENWNLFNIMPAWPWKLCSKCINICKAIMSRRCQVAQDKCNKTKNTNSSYLKNLIKNILLVSLGHGLMLKHNQEYQQFYNFVRFPWDSKLVIILFWEAKINKLI